MPTDFDLSEFKDIFIEECIDNLDTLESGLLEIGKKHDKELVNRIFRAAHSIKGGSATFGYQDIADITHIMETFLDEVRSEKRKVTESDTDTLLKAVDSLRQLVQNHQYNKPLDDNLKNKALETLQDILKAPDETNNAKKPQDLLLDLHQELASADTSIDHTPLQNDAIEGSSTQQNRQTSQLSSDFSDSARQPDDFHQHQAGESFLQSEYSHAENKHDSHESMTVHSEEETTDFQETSLKINDTFEFIEANQIDNKSQTEVQTQASIRVNIDKVDSLLNLLGELVITQSILSQTIENQNKVSPTLSNGITQLQRNTRELQDCVMQIRMLPLNNVFNRIPRLVRDLSNQLNKKVNLTLTGDTTELDKTVLEQISEPLMHLIRNSLDHGIEESDIRHKNGKSDIGQLHIRAYYEGTNVIIDIEDDGAGIDTIKVWQKACENGIVSKEMHYNEDAICDLIFHPGLSTKDNISDVSGRGVGMDVVRRNISKINGTVTAKSKMGYGTLIKVQLPLTLSILEGQLVKVNQDTYIIPILAINESLLFQTEKLHQTSENKTYYHYRERFIPIYWLDELLFNKNKRRINDNSIIIVTEANGETLGVVVDELDAQQQIVLKSMEDNFYHISGVSGATILGDGKVSLIIDIPNLVPYQSAPYVDINTRGDANVA